MKQLIEMIGVTKDFLQGDNIINALEETNFTAYEGELIGIVGPSGSGKSTFLTILGGLQKPTTVKVLLNGKPFSELDVEKIKDKDPNELSGGERQRAAIAKALYHRPSVIFADEPTASLDTKRAYEVVKLLAKETKEQKKATIMVTHDERMLEFCDKVYIIVDGVLSQRTNQ